MKQEGIKIFWEAFKKTLKIQKSPFWPKQLPSHKFKINKCLMLHKNEQTSVAPSSLLLINWLKAIGSSACILTAFLSDAWMKFKVCESCFSNKSVIIYIITLLIRIYFIMKKKATLFSQLMISCTSHLLCFCF